MSTELASDYADQITAGIVANVEAGHPFGVSTEDEPIIDREPGDEGDALDWLDSVLDINYLVHSDGSYKSARICVTFGGPTAWIDTRTAQLEVGWWSATEYRDLPSEFIGGLDDALQELWESR